LPHTTGLAGLVEKWRPGYVRSRGEGGGEEAIEMCDCYLTFGCFRRFVIMYVDFVGWAKNCKKK